MFPARLLVSTEGGSLQDGGRWRTQVELADPCSPGKTGLYVEVVVAVVGPRETLQTI